MILALKSGINRCAYQVGASIDGSDDSDDPIMGGGEVSLCPTRDNTENSNNMQAEGLPFCDF